MGQSSSLYFKRLFHWGTSPDTKLAFIKKFYCSEYTILGIPDTFLYKIRNIKKKVHYGIAIDSNFQQLYIKFELHTLFHM
jgi:hypothetical protein